MALRVLLADESSTIKKVFQLALQDFAVEVRPVNIGIDVATVATGFKPDIIFADVLLQKKNGYEVCAELKQDAHLRGIPVVLMWSGFMELDEDKFQASQANAQLEKPFDVTALRKLVTELVPRTQNQRLSQFLTFPKAIAEAEKRPEILESSTPPKVEEDFQSVSIPKMKGEKYRLNLKPEDLDPNHIAVDYEVPGEGTATTTGALDNEPEEFTLRENKRPAPPPVPVVKAAAAKQPVADLEDIDLDMEDTGDQIAAATPATPEVVNGALTHEQLEKIIREQSAEVIESVVWKVIPELAAQIIERELNKLLKERDSHPF